MRSPSEEEEIERLNNEERIKDLKEKRRREKIRRHQQYERKINDIRNPKKFETDWLKRSEKHFKQSTVRAAEK